MKFRFKLQTVLKLRRHEENMEKQKLGLVLNEWQDLKDQKLGIEQSLSSVNQQFMSTSDFNMITMKNFYGFIHDQHNVLHRLDSELETAEEKVTEQRKKLLEANKQTRMLEKLREKEQSRFRREMEHIEQVELNEIATQRFNRTN